MKLKTRRPGKSTKILISMYIMCIYIYTYIYIYIYIFMYIYIYKLAISQQLSKLVGEKC